MTFSNKYSRVIIINNISLINGAENMRYKEKRFFTLIERVSIKGTES